MEVWTTFSFDFETEDQRNEMIGVLTKKKRLEPLIAAYMKFKGEPKKKWSKWCMFDSLLDDISVTNIGISGTADCFNEWDPKGLVSELLSHISKKYPLNSFKGELEMNHDDGYINMNFSFDGESLNINIDEETHEMEFLEWEDEEYEDFDEEYEDLEEE